MQLQNPFSQRQADTEVASWELLLRDPEAFWLTQHGLLRVWMLVSVGSFAWSCYLDFITAQVCDACAMTTHSKCVIWLSLMLSGHNSRHWKCSQRGCLAVPCFGCLALAVKWFVWP